VLFVGAGISYDLVPTWKELVAELLHKALAQHFKENNKENGEESLHYRWIDNEFDMYDKAVLIQRLLGSQFLFHLHKALYNNIVGLPKTDTLSIIANLCRQGKVRAVVTYNYDNLLENAINDNSRDVEKDKNYAVPVYGKQQNRVPENKLPIYHVHGYLPLRGIIDPNDENSNIILARQEYHNQMIKPYAWQTTLQLEFLRQDICLFLGTSMTDMNMLRMAHHALQYGTKAQKYIICVKDYYFSGMHDKPIINEKNKIYTKNIYTNKDRDNIQAQNDILRLQASLLDEIGIQMVLAKDENQYLEYFHELTKVGKIQK